MPKTAKFYAVANGRKCGIFRSWAECEAQTKRYAGAIFKSFKLEEDAKIFLKENKVNIPSEIEQLDQKRVSEECEETLREVKRQKVPKNHLQVNIHFDGGSRGNPGLAGSGAYVVVIEDESTKQQKRFYIRKYIARATNNVAEYEGLLLGLQKVQTIAEDFVCRKKDEPCSIEVHVRGDSQLIIRHLKGVYECKSLNLKPLYKRALDIKSLIEQCVEATFSFEHIYREENTVADSLANEAMDEKRSWETDEN